MNNYLLLIYPILFLGILFWKADFYKKGQYNDGCMSIEMSKNIQVIAAFFIILHHLVQRITDYGDIYKGPITVFNSTGFLFTSIFFFYSGYGLYVSYKNKENYLDSFFSKRIPKILIPFMVLNIIYLIPNGVAEGRIIKFYEALTSLWGFTLINTNAWFIIVILFLYVAFYFAFKYLKNDASAIKAVIIFTVLLITISLLLGHDRSRLNGHWFMGEWWFNTMILFPIGIIFAYGKNHVIEFIKRHYIICLVISVAAFIGTFILEEITINRIGYYTETYTNMHYMDKAVTLFSQILTCAMFIFMIVVISLKISTGNRVLKFISPLGIELYLVQDLFINFFDKDSPMPYVESFGIIFIESLVGAIIVHFIDKKIIELIDDYKNGRLSNAESDEEKQRQKKKRTVIKTIIFTEVVLAVLTVIGTVNYVYNISFVRNRIINNEMEIIKNAKIGDVVSFGRFDTEYLTLGEVDLKWVVIGREDGKALLISESILFDYSYNEKYTECDYEACDLRECLIYEGFYKVFYEGERKNMLPDDECGDYVFLLSPNQADIYFSDDAARCANQTSWWWLRGEGEPSIKAPVIDNKGGIQIQGENVIMSSGGVRPAIWVCTD